MSLTLTVLISLLSAGMLAGRVYEILNLTDVQTGFLLVNGIVLNPYIMAVFVVIAVCCGILIFGSYKKVKPFYSKSSRYTAALAGVSMAAAGVLAIGTDKVAVFFVAGGAALVIMAITHLGKKKTDYLVMVLLLVFAAGICMDVVSFDVSSYHNTEFLQRVLGYISMIAFVLMVLKNVYMPSASSRMLLYITGVIAFAWCSMMSLASIICYVISDGQSVQKLVMDIAVALFGIYAFDTAVSVIPSAKEINAEKKAAEGIKIITEEAETENEIKTAEDETAPAAFEDADAETEKIIAEENAIEHEQNAAEQTVDDDCNDLANLFEALALEKETAAEAPQPEIINIMPEEICEQEEETEKYNVLSEIFVQDDTTEVPAVNQTIFSETRSFKKITEPKLDESAPEYDMLKSMFRGEDTSAYDFSGESEDNTVKSKKESKQKHSLFGGAKKEKAAKGKATAKKETVPLKSEKSDGKIKFVASEPRQAKGKTETKKVVYKKPK